MFGLALFVELEWRTHLNRNAIDVPVLLENNATEMPFHKVHGRCPRKFPTHEHMLSRENSTGKTPILKLNMMTTGAGNTIEVTSGSQFEKAQPLLLIKHHQYAFAARQAIHLLIFAQSHIC